MPGTPLGSTAPLERSHGDRSCSGGGRTCARSGGGERERHAEVCAAAGGDPSTCSSAQASRSCARASRAARKRTSISFLGSQERGEFARRRLGRKLGEVNQIARVAVRGRQDNPRLHIKQALGFQVPIPPLPHSSTSCQFPTRHRYCSRSSAMHLLR
jgi:hypothetical protein